MTHQTDQQRRDYANRRWKADKAFRAKHLFWQKRRRLNTVGSPWPIFMDGGKAFIRKSSISILAQCSKTQLEKAFKDNVIHSIIIKRGEAAFQCIPYDLALWLCEKILHDKTALLEGNN